MIEINLLPKGYLKGSSSLSFSTAGKYVALGVCAFALLLVAISFYQMQQLAELEENIMKADRRADALRQDIRMVDALVGVKDKITRRMTAVEQLDRHRSAWVRILEDLSRNVPEFIWLAKVTENMDSQAAVKGSRNRNQKADTTVVANTDPNVRPLEVSGYSFTLNALAAFMIKMMRSDYFDDVELVTADEVVFDEDGRVVRTKDRNTVGQKAYDFKLTCNVHYLTEEELRNIIAAADESDEDKAPTSSHKKLN